ncbi:MAG: HAD-IIIA family hydrolase [Magnetococcales bacterium]|nr:HAD-IIIA family hydrolase [Magnetococcales bacterium]
MKKPSPDQTLRVVLMDRDGVLNRNMPDTPDGRSDYVKTPDELEVLSCAPPAIRRLNEAGYTVIVITNQACIGKGIISHDDLTAIHAKLQAAVREAGGEIAAFHYCPHHPDDGCDCRKPKPGMIYQALKTFPFDLGATWMVGDSTRDVECAVAAGCCGALVRTGHGMKSVAAMPEVPAYENVGEFVEALLRE